MPSDNQTLSFEHFELDKDILNLEDDLSDEYSHFPSPIPEFPTQSRSGFNCDLSRPSGTDLFRPTTKPTLSSRRDSGVSDLSSLNSPKSKYFTVNELRAPDSADSELMAAWLPSYMTADPTDCKPTQLDLVQQRWNCPILPEVKESEKRITAKTSAATPKSTRKRKVDSVIAGTEGSSSRPGTVPDETKEQKKRRSKSTDATEDLHRRQHLERNRLAASKCRNKQKAWTKQLEAKAKEVEGKNQRLKAELAWLQLQVLSLKDEITRHSSCEDGLVRSYLDREIEKLVGGPMSRPSDSDKSFSNNETPITPVTPVTPITPVTPATLQDTGCTPTALEDMDNDSIDEFFSHPDP